MYTGPALLVFSKILFHEKYLSVSTELTRDKKNTVILSHLIYPVCNLPMRVINL